MMYTKFVFGLVAPLLLSAPAFAGQFCVRNDAEPGTELSWTLFTPGGGRQEVAYVPQGSKRWVCRDYSAQKLEAMIRAGGTRPAAEGCFLTLEAGKWVIVRGSGGRIECLIGEKGANKTLARAQVHKIADVLGTAILVNAQLEKPLAGATVRVLDKSGRVVHTEANATNAMGTAYISAPGDLSAGFDLEVSGGRVGGRQNHDTLGAAVESYEGGAVLVNGLTTLARLHAQRQRLEKNAAQDAVERYFGVGRVASLGVLESPAFSQRKLLAESERDGGLTRHLDRVSDEIARHPDTARPLRGEAPMQKDKRDLFTEINKGLGKAALGMAGDQVIGWYMHELGLSPANDQQALQYQLLQRIDVKIDQISTQLAGMEKRLIEQMKKSEYNTRLTTLRLGTIAWILSKHADRVVAGTLTNAVSRARVFNEVATAVDKDMKDKLRAFHGEVDAGVANNMQGLWAEIALPRFLDQRYYDSVETNVDYFRGAYLLGLDLYLDSLHYLRPNESEVAKKFYDELSPRFDTILEVLPAGVPAQARVPEGTVLDRETNLLWAQKQVAKFCPPYLYPPHFTLTAAYKDYPPGNWRVASADEVFRLLNSALPQVTNNSNQPVTGMAAEQIRRGMIYSEIYRFTGDEVGKVLFHQAGFVLPNSGILYLWPSVDSTAGIYQTFNYDRASGGRFMRVVPMGSPPCAKSPGQNFALSLAVRNF